MIEISHTYSLTAQWQQELTAQFIKQIGSVLIDKKRVVMAKDIADGGFYYANVVSGVSVVIWDLVFKEPIFIKKLKCENDLCIVHYDFSDEMNLIFIDGVKHNIGYKANLGLGVFDNAVENVFQPVVGERVFVMQMLVAKKILNFSVPIEFAEDFNINKSKNKKNTIFFYDYIDSESKLLLHAIKNKTFLDPAFDIYIRGNVLKLLAIFIDRYSNLQPMFYRISEEKKINLDITKDYLLNNLFVRFPGVTFLADMSTLSVSKYKALFKKRFVETPNQFFMKEKLNLAHTLLKSGKFSSIAEVALKLNYTKFSYFTSKYYEHFKRKPSQDFVKSDL